MTNYSKTFILEFRRALLLYSTVFFGTILISIVAFYIYGTIKQSHIMQNAVVTAVSYLGAIIVGITGIELMVRTVKIVFQTKFEYRKRKSDAYSKLVAAAELERLDVKYTSGRRF